MPRVPDEWFVVDVDAKVRLRRHTEVGVLLLEVEVEGFGVVLSFDVSGSWAEAVYRAYEEHLAEPPVLPGIMHDTGLKGLDAPDAAGPPNESLSRRPGRRRKRDDGRTGRPNEKK